VTEEARPSLAQFIHCLRPELKVAVSETESRDIPVHAEPASDGQFLSLGELPPGAPPIDPGRFPFVGTRQIFVYRSDTPPHLYQRLAVGLRSPRPSGTGGTGMFGNPEEHAVDADAPSHSWRQINAGEPYGPSEL